MGCDASNAGMPEQPLTMAQKQGKLTIYGDDFDPDTRILKAILAESECEFNFTELHFLDPEQHKIALAGKSPGVFPFLVKDHLHSLCENQNLIDTLLEIEPKAKAKFNCDAEAAKNLKVLQEFFYTKVRPMTSRLIRRSYIVKREGEAGRKKIESESGMQNFGMNFYAFEKNLL